MRQPSNIKTNLRLKMINYSAYFKAVLRRKLKRGIFSELQYFCMFIGYPRSGHTLIKSLLDAHPNIVISNELNVLKCIKNGFDREHIFKLILKKSEEFIKWGQHWWGYDYAVPNQWNGRYRSILVIGDKKGGNTSRMLKEDPSLLNILIDKIDIDIKFIHVMRNPFDTISTIAIRSGRSIDEIIDFYFQLADSVSSVRDIVDDKNWFDLRYESFITSPEKHLKSLCEFLGQMGSEVYYKDCVNMVNNKPHKSRSEVEWHPRNTQRVNDHIRNYSFFNGYTYG